MLDRLNQIKFNNIVTNSLVKHLHYCVKRFKIHVDHKQIQCFQKMQLQLSHFPVQFIRKNKKNYSLNSNNLIQKSVVNSLQTFKEWQTSEQVCTCFNNIHRTKTRCHIFYWVRMFFQKTTFANSNSYKHTEEKDMQVT